MIFKAKAKYIVYTNYFSIRYNQRPPSLLAPGVLHFRTEQSHNYYFHPKVREYGNLYNMTFTHISSFLIIYKNPSSFSQHFLNIGCPYHKSVALYETLSSWSKDKFRMRCYRKASTTDNVVERWPGTKLLLWLWACRRKYSWGKSNLKKSSVL